MTQTSIAARSASINWDDLNWDRSYTAMKAYEQSKLACGLFGFELDRLSQEYGWGITSSVSHPGVAPTNLLAARAELGRSQDTVSRRVIARLSSWGLLVGTVDTAALPVRPAPQDRGRFPSVAGLGGAHPDPLPARLSGAPALDGGRTQGRPRADLPRPRGRHPRHLAFWNPTTRTPVTRSMQDPIPVGATRPRRPWQAWALAAVELFVTYQAVNGGIGLMTDSWQMPIAWLARTPFHTWVGPGWILIGLVGVPHLLAAVPPLLMPARPKLGILAGLLAGASLLVWIGMQLALLQVYFFLQPVIAVIGIIEAGLAYWWLRRVRANTR